MLRSLYRVRVACLRLISGTLKDHKTVISWSMFTIVFLLLLVLDCCVGDNSLFNLVETGKMINSSASYQQVIVFGEKFCTAKCHCDQPCLSYEVIPAEGNRVECRLHSRPYMFYQKNGTSIKNRPGSKIYSKDIKTSCEEWFRSGANTNGVYKVYLLGIHEKLVYCYMEGEGGGWLVFQRRFDGSVSFSELWKRYKDGFGDVGGEFWLGNHWLHLLTSSSKHDLYVMATDHADQTEVKRFSHFTIGSEDDKYVFDYHHVYTDGYSVHKLFEGKIKGMKFSTPDQDNDLYGDDCGAKYKCGWWFKDCFDDNFNGGYDNGNKYYGIHWKAFTTHYKSLKKTMMMIKAVH